MVRVPGVHAPRLPHAPNPRYPAPHPAPVPHTAGAQRRALVSRRRLAIILSAVGDFSSTKVRLRNAHLYKEHTLRALELDPRDATLHHMMGRFCFEVAGA